MSITIEGVPEFITHEQYMGLFEACGFTPATVLEVRMANDGVHALVFALNEHGARTYNPNTQTYNKHRVFIPVRKQDEDTRTTRVTAVRG